MRRLFLPALLCALTVTASAVPRARRAAPRPVLAAVSDPAAFTPPNDPRALENAFWQAIWKLERRQIGAPDAEPLADAVRAEIGRLRPEEASAVMRLFLAAAYHYEGAEEGTLSQEIRQRHEERFSDRVRDFARLTRRLADGGGPAAAEALFARVRALAGPGAAGLELSKRLSDADPKNAHALTRLAWDLSDTGDLKGAVEASERAIGLSSAASSAYTVLASAKYQMRDVAGANAAANKALALDPGDKKAYGIVTLTQDRLPAAMMAVDGMAAMELEDSARRDAVAAPPAPGAAALARGLADSARAALRQKDYVRAESLASEALAADPDNVNALSRRALARMRRERLDDALADSARALELMGNAPNHVHLTIHAQILNRLSRCAEALPLAERSLSLNPPTDRSRAQALFQKAWALAGTGERKASLKTLAQAARLYRRYVPFYQEAAAQPEDTDLTLVFASDWLAADPAPAAAPSEEPAGSLFSGQRPLIILAFSVLGGLLIATGLLRAAQARSASPTTAPGTPVPSVDGLLAGTYRMGARIGSGGMGIVFEAFDVNLERRVAIKKMREEICADPRERERFLREARTVAALKHPNIVEIHAVVGDGRDVYLVFEHVDGHTVTEYLQSYRRIPFDQAVRVTQGAAAALDYAHARGVVHRDLKPSNIMITREGVVKVMDFGVARQAKDTLGAIGSTETVAGTPQYMSPEQEQGSVRAESDVFALGVCLYEMVTGSLPFQGVGVTMSLNKTKRAYLPASRAIAGLPPGTDQVIDWALDPDPEKRCKTPLRFAQAAEALLRPRVGLKPPDQVQPT